MSCLRDKRLVTDRTRNAIRQARLARGMDQQELAERIGLSRQALGAIESGAATPSTAVALKLAAALDRPGDQLFWLEPRRTTAGGALAQAARKTRGGGGGGGGAPGGGGG